MTAETREFPDHLQAAFEQEELKGLRLGARARIVTMAVIAVWLGIQLPFPEVAYIWALLIGFAFTGWLPYDHRRRGRRWRWPMTQGEIELTIAA